MARMLLPAWYSFSSATKFWQKKRVSTMLDAETTRVISPRLALGAAVGAWAAESAMRRIRSRAVSASTPVTRQSRAPARMMLSSRSWDSRWATPISCEFGQAFWMAANTFRARLASFSSMATSTTGAPVACTRRLTRDRSVELRHSRFHSDSSTRSSQTRAPTSSATQIMDSLMGTLPLPAQAAFDRLACTATVDHHVQPAGAAVLVFFAKIANIRRQLSLRANQPGGDHHDQLFVFRGDAV